jgi:hypothetical protein
LNPLKNRLTPDRYIFFDGKNVKKFFKGKNFEFHFLQKNEMNLLERTERIVGRWWNGRKRGSYFLGYKRENF